MKCVFSIERIRPSPMLVQTFSYASTDLPPWFHDLSQACSDPLKRHWGPYNIDAPGTSKGYSELGQRTIGPLPKTKRTF